LNIADTITAAKAPIANLDSLNKPTNLEIKPSVAVPNVNKSWARSWKVTASFSIGLGSITVWPKTLLPSSMIAFVIACLFSKLVNSWTVFPIDDEKLSYASSAEITIPILFTNSVLPLRTASIILFKYKNSSWIKKNGRCLG